MAQAQLGAMPSVQLGGYIPAARKDPELWKLALAQFAGNAGGKVADVGIDMATAPDQSKYDPATGDVGKQAWYKRNLTPQEISAMNQGYGAREGVRLEGEKLNDTRKATTFDQEYKNKMGVLTEQDMKARHEEANRLYNLEAEKARTADKNTRDTIAIGAGQAQLTAARQKVQDLVGEHNQQIQNDYLQSQTDKNKNEIALKSAQDNAGLRIAAKNEIMNGRNLSKHSQAILDIGFRYAEPDPDPNRYYQNLLRAGSKALTDSGYNNEKTVQEKVVGGAKDVASYLTAAPAWKAAYDYFTGPSTTGAKPPGVTPTPSTSTLSSTPSPTSQQAPQPVPASIPTSPNQLTPAQQAAYEEFLKRGNPDELYLPTP